MNQSTDSEPTFTSAEREAVDDLGTTVRFPPGSLIIKEGERNDFVVLLHEGHVVIEKGQPHQITVGICGPGELVGEMASLIEEPRTASIRSIGEVKAQLIPADDWRAFLFQHSRALYAHAQQLAQKLKKSTQIGVDSMLTSEQKLIKAMVKLADSGLGTEDKGGTPDIQEPEPEEPGTNGEHLAGIGGTGATAPESGQDRGDRAAAPDHP